MKLELPKGPRYLPAPTNPHGGVDFLGLRQANLDMMASCLPGISNVTESVRVFSVLSFLHARFYARVSKGNESATSLAAYRAFRERIEVLFTWGHVRKDQSVQRGDRSMVRNDRSVPGKLAKPPSDDDSVELTFKAWSRSYANTGLMAAVQYGPASKTSGGLGFLDPVDGGFYRVTATGQVLARAIDEQLAAIPESTVLDEDETLGSAETADALMTAWDVTSPTEGERAAFYDAESLDGQHGLARRSRTLNLAFEALVGGALTHEELRRAMTYAMHSDGTPLALTPAQADARLRWAVLQVRQAQRFGHECLLPWIEAEVDAGARTTPHLVQRAMGVISRDAPGWRNRLIGEIADGLIVSDTFESLCAAAVGDDDVCLFKAIERTREMLRNEDDGLIVAALRTVLLCYRATILLAGANVSRRLLQTGRSERVSLEHWVDTVSRCRSWPLERFLPFLFETLVLSQHFAVAAMRNDGGTQRLRVAIEEGGLVVLAPIQWAPRLTPDRLEAAMRLSADCGLVHEEAGRFEFAP